MPGLFAMHSLVFIDFGRIPIGIKKIDSMSQITVINRWQTILSTLSMTTNLPSK